MTAPIKLVYSSAPEDYPFAKQLAAHLHTHTQHGLFSAWDEQFLPAGADVALERRRAWREADILLLLLSADYFGSVAYDEQEMQQALKRHQAGQLLIVPILVRPFDWQASVVGHLRCLPRDGRAVTAWENRDAALNSIGQDLRKLIAERRASNAPLSARQRTDRQRLLKRVRTIWVDGWLEQSLHHATWIDLHLQKQPHGLESPWRLMVQELDRGPRPLPPGTSIIQVFDDADEELLILGEPGSGKTTLLMYLARTLLDRAEADESRRIPVVLNLSSWAQRRLPLDDWLIAEMHIRYQVPVNVGRSWVQTKQIFPLLDGLDEVADAARVACTQALIDYLQREHERLPLIVCCRIEEYQALTVELPLQYAVMLLPLSDEQIEVYLSSVSGKLDTLRQVLREDKELFELARRPLMLSIFTQTYHGETAPDLPAVMSRDEYPRALFKQYVKGMLGRRTKLQQWNEEQFLYYLTYFATQLYRQQQTIFAVEELQPAWLPERYRSHYRWGMFLAYVLTFGLCFGPVFGLAFGAAYGFIYWVLGRLVFGVIFGLVLGIVGGLSGGLVFGLVFKQHKTIQPAEVTAWSWTSAKKGLLVGTLAGLAFGLVGGVVGWVKDGAIGAVVVGCAAGGIMGLFVGLIGGLLPMQMPERLTLTPNEGIRRSGKRGLGMVLLFILLVGMMAGLIVGRLGASIGDMRYALMYGLIFGSVGGLLFAVTFNLVGGRTGLSAFLEHFVLRLFLWRYGLLPWQLVSFLDEATERLLLRKVGGSYIFVHRLLRDVLAMYSFQSPPGKDIGS